MLFPDRDAPGRGDAIRLIRDVVEIVAIVAAGIWAFYVFVYENRIKPSFEAPDLVVTASMEKTSRHAGSIGVLVKTDFRNVGGVPIHFEGLAVTVLGRRVTLRAQPRRTSLSKADTNEEIRTYYELSDPVRVYSYGAITALGNPASKSGLELDPGQEIPQQQIFFVPGGRFDLLTVYVSARFTKSDERVIPSTLGLNHRGVLDVRGDDNLSEHWSFEVSSLDLNS